MEVWIIFKTQSFNRDILFTEYLEKVKGSLGGLWNEKFLTPTQNFFMTLYYEWNHLKQNNETDTEEKVMLFIKKVKENMFKVWEESIVKKVEELSNKRITYQQNQNQQWRNLTNNLYTQWKSKNSKIGWCGTNTYTPAASPSYFSFGALSSWITI